MNVRAVCALPVIIISVNIPAKAIEYTAARQPIVW
jgi:hypothetical protein